MLAVGRGIMSDPTILMVDELSLGLAPVLTLQLFQSMRQLREAGITVLLVEQNAAMALAISHRGYVLETGSIQLEGNASDLAGNDLVRQAYLGG